MKDPIAFFVFGEFYSWMEQANYFNYLKHCYPDCRLLLYLTNPVQYYQKSQGMFVAEESYKLVHSTFDAVITYNPIDAVNFGLVYYPGLYSVLPLEKQTETSDIFFIGAAKDRLHKIIGIYKQLKANGFGCDFHITNVPKDLQELPQEIHYNKPLSYFEVLDHVMKSRGILEIAHGGNSGLTLRFFEALVYDKNFVTDNTFLHNSEFRSFKKVFPIRNSPRLDVDLDEYRAAAKLVNNYRNEYSPTRLIVFLEALLNQIKS